MGRPKLELLLDMKFSHRSVSSNIPVDTLVKIFIQIEIEVISFTFKLVTAPKPLSEDCFLAHFSVNFCPSRL